MMERINKVVKWRNIEALLREYYEVEKSKEGADTLPSVDVAKVPIITEVVSYSI